MILKMTSRYIKNDDGLFIKGVNGKKLRYIFNKVDKKIQVKFKTNWTQNAIDKLEFTYNNFNIEYENNKRGRPKNKTPVHISRIKETKIKNMKSAATYDTSDEDENENAELYFIPFDIGNRVKMLVEPYIRGEIINFDYLEKLIIIKEDNTETIVRTKKRMIKKMRGRRPKSNINTQKKEKNIINNNIDDTLELLKHNGKVYIINKENEVMTLNGEYVGDYLKGEII